MLTRHTLQINNAEVVYWQRPAQSNQDPTILFVHGFKGNHKGLTAVSEALPGFQSILVDLPGYGESAKFFGNHSIINYAHFLHQFIQQLHISKLHLVGHSYGASIAVVFAGLYSSDLNKLVLVSPATPFNSLTNILAGIQLKTARLLPAALQKSWLASPALEVATSLLLVKTVSRKRRLQLMKASIQNSQEQHPQVIMECLASYIDTPFYTYAQKITAPTLIIAGQKDIVAPLNTQVLLGQKIPNSFLNLLPTMGHLAPLEAPGTLATLINQFITQTPS